VNHLHKLFLACLFAQLCLSGPAPAMAATQDEIRALKEQLQQTQIMLEGMQKRLAQLEQQQAEQQATQQHMQSTQQQMQTQVQEATEAAAEAPPAPSGNASANAFNPEISAVLNGKYQAFSQDPNNFAVPGFAPGNAAGLDSRGLNLSESELDVASNVDNLFYGSLTVSLAQNGGANVEEAYFQTLDMPLGLTIKGGRFFSGIGYLNQFHAHHDDFIDRPLPYRVFLNNQYGDDGLQLRWLAPTDTFLELGGETLRGANYPAGGSAWRGMGTWDVFANVGDDVGISNSWKAGISYLSARAQGRQSFDNTGAVTGTFDGTSDLALADFVWKWAPNGNPVNQNFRFQSELFYRKENGLFNAATYNGRQWGWYGEGVYQFMPRWEIGYRHAELYAHNSGLAVTAGSLLDNLGHTPRRDSLVVGFSNSEFSRIRAQFSRDNTQAKLDYQLSLQYLMLLGAHGAHQF
jgi:hypothetical protein